MMAVIKGANLRSMDKLKRSATIRKRDRTIPDETEQRNDLFEDGLCAPAQIFKL
jgi:hypothetical protein